MQAAESTFNVKITLAITFNVCYYSDSQKQGTLKIEHRPQRKSAGSKQKVEALTCPLIEYVARRASIESGGMIYPFHLFKLSTRAAGTIPEKSAAYDVKQLSGIQEQGRPRLYPTARRRQTQEREKIRGALLWYHPEKQITRTAGNEAIRPYKFRRPPTQSRANAARVIHVTIYRKKRLLVDHLHS